MKKTDKKETVKDIKQRKIYQFWFSNDKPASNYKVSSLSHFDIAKKKNKTKRRQSVRCLDQTKMGDIFTSFYLVIECISLLYFLGGIFMFWEWSRRIICHRHFSLLAMIILWNCCLTLLEFYFILDTHFEKECQVDMHDLLSSFTQAHKSAKADRYIYI